MVFDREIRIANDPWRDERLAIAAIRARRATPEA
jgi:hypothetical protein